MSTTMARPDPETKAAFSKPGMKRRRGALALLAGWILCWAAVAVFPGDCRAETKNFYFPEVRIDVGIARDGSFTVDEFRTYEFEGRFSWASLWIPLHIRRGDVAADVRIEDFAVLDEGGDPLRTETGLKNGRFEAKWFYSAGNEKRTFHIRYRIREGITSYPDVSELYWKVIGESWDKPTAAATVTVRLPEPAPRADDIRVYGHGPLSGWSEIVDAGTARFEASNIPAGQFLEIRFCWPAGIVEGVPSSAKSFESIRAEEARFVEETIARVERARETRARSRRNFQLIAGAWGVWGLLGPLLWLVFYLRSWKKVGRDYSFDDIPEYYRELPSDLPPALVQILMREGRGVTPSAFTATIFDLARRGYIEIEDRSEEKKTFLGGSKAVEVTTVRLRRDLQTEGPAVAYEKDLCEFLFRTVGGTEGRKGDGFRLDELKDYLKKKAPKFQTWYLAWAKSIAKEAKSRQFIEPESLRARNVFLAVSIPVAVLTVNPLLVVLAAVLIPKMKRRGRDWARENEHWKALRRFLDDFSDFEELPPEAYKLWEHYLVYGILFGNAKKILKRLPVILEDERASAPAWYYGFNRSFLLASGGIGNMVSSIEHISASIAQASTSAAHYSAGGGGGFSGGGGGGGGGGSAG
ncbi:MAG: DUF2207 family protein [Candidatus Aminicenantales bacterium]